MNRLTLAAAGLTLSCLLAACGGGGEDASPAASSEALTQTETAQSALRMTAQAQRRIAPEQFTRGVREVHDTVVWQQTETTVADVTAQRTYSDRITAINDDASFAFERRSGTGAVFERYQSNPDGNRLSRDIVANGNHCTYNPNRNFVSYPLYVGKVWASTWDYNCSLGYQETAHQLAAVTGRETINIPAGSYDALRIGYVTLFNNSNDINLEGGSTGQAAYLQEATCWWATEVHRIVKCTYKNTFFGATPPASYLKEYTLEASFVGKQYYPGAHRVGQSSLWTDTDTYVSGASASRTYTQTVTAVNANGSYGVDRTESNGYISERYLNDFSGNRLTRFISSSANNCAYTPRRDYLRFPLYVGKTWNSTWHYGCALGYQEDATHSAQVEALEQITTAGGTHNALRVRFQTVLTNSNDFQLENGSIGQASYAHDGVCWWSVDTQRLVKCDLGISYTGPAPAHYRQRYVTEAAGVLVP